MLIFTASVGFGRYLEQDTGVLNDLILKHEPMNCCTFTITTKYISG